MTSPITGHATTDRVTTNSEAGVAARCHASHEVIESSARAQTAVT